jgi:hypothetical protein
MSFSSPGTYVSLQGVYEPGPGSHRAGSVRMDLLRMLAADEVVWAQEEQAAITDEAMSERPLVESRRVWLVGGAGFSRWLNTVPE